MHHIQIVHISSWRNTTYNAKSLVLQDYLMMKERIICPDHRLYPINRDMWSLNKVCTWMGVP